MALGEVMLRLDPGEARIATTRSFRAWEGGGEYNVARGLRRCFGLRTAIVTALADNPVGRLIEDLMLQGGSSRRSSCGALRRDRAGGPQRAQLHRTRFRVRGAVGCSDRGHTAASQLRAGRRRLGADLRRGGRPLVPYGRRLLRPLGDDACGRREAVAAARRHGAVVSYDLNYRPRSALAVAPSAAAGVNRELVRHVDVLFGNEEDFSAALGYPLEEADENLLELDVGSYERLLGRCSTIIRRSRSSPRPCARLVPRP